MSSLSHKMVKKINENVRFIKELEDVLDEGVIDIVRHTEDKVVEVEYIMRYDDYFEDMDERSSGVNVSNNRCFVRKLIYVDKEDGQPGEVMVVFEGDSNFAMPFKNLYLDDKIGLCANMISNDDDEYDNKDNKKAKGEVDKVFLRVGPIYLNIDEDELEEFLDKLEDIIDKYSDGEYSFKFE